MILLRILAFISGGVLMSLEMLGSRFLAPQYGNSVIVWASLISVFLAGLTAGYWLGGMLADRWPRLSGLGTVLSVAGVFVLAIPFAAPAVFVFVGSSTRIGSLASATILFFIPTMLLGAVSPYAIRLSESDRATLGRTAGLLYAISTAGSIAGTLITAFWLIPIAGVSNLTFALAITLLLEAAVIGVVGGERRRFLRLATAVALGAAAIIVVVAPRSLLGRIRTASGQKTIYERDSFYHHIIVTDDQASDTRRLRFDNTVQSAMSIENPLVARTRYTDYLHLAMVFNPGARNVLLIGLGGGTATKQFLNDYPAISVDVVEIDPEVVAVARRFFGLPKPSARFRIFVDDGRRFLAKSDRMYDAIIIDAFHRDLIPFHLATEEFFTLCRDRLNPGGYVVMNIIGSRKGRASGAVASIYATAGRVFRARYLFAVSRGVAAPARIVSNNILVAGRTEQMKDDGFQRQLAAARGVVRPEYLQLARDHVAEGPDLELAKVLTDEYAPVEDLLRY